MKQLDLYISEKLVIDKSASHVSIDEIKNKAKEIIHDYCKNKLHLKEKEYEIKEDDSNKNVVGLYSKNYKFEANIDNIDRDLVVSFRKSGLACSNSRPYSTVIYFYFSEDFPR